MNNSTLRTISLAGLLLVTIGFFMPFLYNLSGIQFVGFPLDHNLYSNLPSYLNPSINLVGFSSLFLFLISFIGVILFIFSIIKKNFNTNIIWIIFILFTILQICIFSGIAEIYKILTTVSIESFDYISEIEPLYSSVNNTLNLFKEKNIFKSGAYVILTGSIIFFVFHIMTFIITRLNINLNIIRK